MSGEPASQKRNGHFLAGPRRKFRSLVDITTAQKNNSPVPILTGPSKLNNSQIVPSVFPAKTVVGMNYRHTMSQRLWIPKFSTFQSSGHIKANSF